MQTMLSGATPPPPAECWICTNYKNCIFREEMFAGRQVQMHGLQKSAEHNGKQGVVLKLLDGGRVGVRLLQPSGAAKELSIKRENLSPLEVEAAVPAGTLAAGGTAPRSGEVTKSFLVCWPLSLLANLKPQTKLSKGPRFHQKTPVANLTFSDQLKYRLRMSVDKQDGTRSDTLASITAHSLQNDQPLTNICGQVLTSTCAFLSRPDESAPDAPLTVLFRAPKPINGLPQLGKDGARGKNSIWSDCGIGDCRVISMFSLGQEVASQSNLKVSREAVLHSRCRAAGDGRRGRDGRRG
jgi:hypothetical protein